MIVDQVASYSRLTFDGLKTDKLGNPALLLPLLWTCHNLRDVVYGRLCSHYNHHLNADTRNLFVCWPGWPSGLDKRSHAAHRLVRRLTLKLDLQYICSGKALQLLSREPFGNDLFPKTRVVKFYLYWLEDAIDQQLGAADHLSCAEANICAFVQRVKQLAPMVSDIIVKPQFEPFIHEGNTAHLFSSLISQLFQLASRAGYEAFGPYIPMPPQLKTLPNLTRITYDDEFYGRDVDGQFVQMVRRSAQTLQYLVIRARDIEDAHGLVQDDDGRCIAYPCLVTLKLEQREFFSTVPLPVTSGAIPFPSLRHLSIGDLYPFGDDTPFRGNAATLEYLHIMPRRETCDILHRFSVFTPTSHPKLQCVSTPELLDNARPDFQSLNDLVQFVLSIAPNAAVLDIGITGTVDDTFHAFDVLKNHANIQVLFLSTMNLSLSLVVSLIEWLPLLSDLHCLTVDPDPLYHNVSPDEILAYTQSLNGVKNKRFRYWRLFSENRYYCYPAVVCVLAVSSICPNFTHIAFPNDKHNRFMAALEEAIKSGKYKQFEPRLRRLLFKK
ncbi:hypothetical protein GGF42_001212 [Coemansia sp. RSA 2424]|nr:hypothetical protein GGF42_001212 [Coemansia sp. RSA 2424]